MSDTSITEIYHGMSLTVLYFVFKNENVKVKDKIQLCFAYILVLQDPPLLLQDCHLLLENEGNALQIGFGFWCLMPLSAISQLYHGDQFQWWKKPKYPERTTDHGQVTGKLYHLRLQVECTLFCNLQSWVRTHAVLVLGLYELLGNPTTQLIEPPKPSECPVD